MVAPDSVRLLFVGTKDFAVPTFLSLLSAGFRVAALITQPERPQGRKQELVPARIKIEALHHHIPVHQPESINSPESLALIRDLAPDLIVTVAYGQILSPEVLAIPRFGAINLHGSVLPAYRGAAPVARAIQNGEQESGVTVILMNPRVDAGGILGVAKTPIGPDETAGELEQRLADLGPGLVPGLILEIVAGTCHPIPQDAAAVSRAPKLRKEEGQIDWTQPAQRIHDLVRAMQPWPTAYSSWIDPESTQPPVRVIFHKTRVLNESTVLEPGCIEGHDPKRLKIATGSGMVEPLIVQLPGKKPITVPDFLRGNRLNSGGRFGDPGGGA